MSQIISNNNIYIKQDDPINFTIKTEGTIKSAIGDTARFMAKSNISDDDSLAIINLLINVTVDGEIEVYVPSADTKDIPIGKYLWSIKHYKQGDSYTIVPDDGGNMYPKLIVGGTLIND